MQMVKCPYCQQDTQEARFCTMCGGKLDLGPKVETRHTQSTTNISISGSVINRSNIGGASEAFLTCPYCGRDLDLPKRPRFCPYCKEGL